jgi:alpha-beta hydrolase superfamily lysophospholipase
MVSRAKSVYYLTGMGGRLDTGLGQGLLSRGWSVTGRELVGEFRDLDFQEQIDLVADDLQSEFWSEDARVIANSFGAYLFLHAQAQMEPYIGQVILLSPIVGSFSSEKNLMGFMPPRAPKLMELVERGAFPVPKQCEIHVGSEDWQSNPENVTAMGSMLGINVTVVPNAGHRLPKEYVGDLLDRWLTGSPSPSSL